MAEPRYPSLDAYVDALPEGSASYPECKAKASLLRDMLASRPIDPEAEDLPVELARIIRDPPPVSMWIPEVSFNAATLAIYDREFGGTDLARFEDWVCDFNAALFRKPLYRVLFLFISPRRLLSNVASRWGAFHRGSTLTLVDLGNDTARLRLQYPSGLFGEVMLHAFGAAWRAAILTAGASSVRSEISRTTATQADYDVRWFD